MRILRIFSLSVVLCLGTLLASAQVNQKSVDRLEELTEVLKLTPEQKQQLSRIFKEEQAANQKNENLKKEEQLLVKQEFESKVADVLTPEQRKRYAQYQEEEKKKLRETPPNLKQERKVLTPQRSNP
jgi:Spy/CpxP family protein refolding chaperone